MIANAFSMVDLFVQGSASVLVLWAGTASFSLARACERVHGPEQRAEIERGANLPLLIAVVALGVKLLSWPLFYGMLQSFIPEIEGAMCIFGVTQVLPNLTRLIEIMKPAVFFMIGGWLTLHVLDRRTATGALLARKLLFLGIVCFVVFVESVAEIILILSISPGLPVSCCTTITDLLERPTRIVPESIMGPGYARIIGYVQVVGTLALTGAMAVMGKMSVVRPEMKTRRLLLGILFTAAVVNLGIFILAQIEDQAPTIMNLPFHHCIYCLWQYVPDTPLMYLLMAIGTFAVGWAFLADLVGRSPETLTILPDLTRKLSYVSVFSLASALLMNVVHLAIARGGI